MVGKAPRAARFADTVRSRSVARPRPGVRLHAWPLDPAAARRLTGCLAPPIRVSQVLASPPRPVVRHHWHPAGAPATRWEIRLNLHAPLPAALRNPATLGVPAGGHTSLRPEDAAPPVPPVVPTAAAPRLAALVHRAAGGPAQQPTPIHPAPPQVSGTAWPHRWPALASPPAPPALAMVQRHPTRTAAGPSGGTLGPTGTAPTHVPPPTLGARWVDAPATGWTRPPLIERDMPLVVDHVVREIDRRVTAARERRGWTG
ncbi:hypothetical protein [Streptomyces sp. NPDC006446]|uniref:hypothetical protein n=1 Tax=Streptomyces sp. NPDC006446 TaxID=3154301 RepID=UPI0033BCE45D